MFAFNDMFNPNDYRSMYDMFDRRAPRKAPARRNNAFATGEPCDCADCRLQARLNAAKGGNVFARQNPNLRNNNAAKRRRTKAGAQKELLGKVVAGQSAVRGFLARRHTASLFNALRQMKDADGAVSEILSRLDETEVASNENELRGVEDDLERVLLRLDGIDISMHFATSDADESDESSASTASNGYLRKLRKQIIARTEAALDRVDSLKKSLAEDESDASSVYIRDLFASSDASSDVDMDQVEAGEDLEASVVDDDWEEVDEDEDENEEEDDEEEQDEEEEMDEQDEQAPKTELNPAVVDAIERRKQDIRSQIAALQEQLRMLEQAM